MSQTKPTPYDLALIDIKELNSKLREKDFDIDRLSSALRLAQKVLMSLTDESSIKATPLLMAYAQVREAEYEARSALRSLDRDD